MEGEKKKQSWSASSPNTKLEHLMMEKESLFHKH